MILYVQVIGGPSEYVLLECSILEPSCEMPKSDGKVMYRFWLKAPGDCIAESDINCQPLEWATFDVQLNGATSDNSYYKL